jgi:hypothetical protein
MGGAEPEPFQGETTPSKLERYTDPNGQFYKTVLKELQKTTTPDAARDLAQEVMADFTENVKEGKFKLPEHSSEEGRVTNNLKTIAHNKAADWADAASGETASGAKRPLIETKRLSESATAKKASATRKLEDTNRGEDEASPNLPEESKSPYGFGEESDLRDEHSNARRALAQYLEEHPETAAEDKELLLSASKKGLEKAEAARSKAYDKELAASGDVEKAIEAGRKAEDRVNRNKFTATDRYFGLTDAEMTKLGQAQRLTGTKFRARLTAIMDDLNSRAAKGAERTRTAPPSYEGQSGYTKFPSGEGPSRSAFSRITTEEAPTVAKPTETYGDADGFAQGTEKATTNEQREDLGAGQTLPLIPPTEAELTGRFSNIVDATRRGEPIRLAGTSRVPVDLEGAAANRERLADRRVAEAEQALSEATTPAAQRRARVELEDAKDRLNYLKALKQPVSGGSQGVDSSVGKTAADYLKELSGKGVDTAARVEHLIPNADRTIHDVDTIAKRYGVDLVSNKGFTQPTEVSHSGQATSRLPRIAMDDVREPLLISEDKSTPAQVETEAKRILAKNEGDANRAARAKEEQNINSLAKARERLGLRHSFSSDPTETVGKKPVVGGADVERLRARSNAKPEYTEKVNQDGLTFHSARAVNPSGETAALVSAVSSPEDPQTWMVMGSFSNVPRTELALDAYMRLAEKVQEAANKSGVATRLVGDSGLFTKEARSAWRRLAVRGRDLFKVEWLKDGKVSDIGDPNSRPSIIFTAKKPSASVVLPRALGGAPKEEPTGFMQRVLGKYNR